MIEENTVIQLANYTDALEIALLSKYEVEQGFKWKWTEEVIKQTIKDQMFNVVVAKKIKRLLGFGIMEYKDEKANLSLLAVKPEYRRSHVGCQIIEWLEEVAITAGIFNIYIQARAQNLTALKFYTHLGYEVIDRVPGYYQSLEDGLIFYKRIA